MMPTCPICKSSELVYLSEESYRCPRIGCDSSFIPSAPIKNPPTLINLPDGSWQLVHGDPIYVYSSYWRNWSRRIMVQTSYVGALDFGSRVPRPTVRKFLDFSLEPINPSSPQEWAEVDGVRLRFHCTSPAMGDVSQKNMPHGLEQRMLSHLEPEQVDFMLHGDVFGSIDFDRFLAEDRLNLRGGGLPIDRCLKV